MSQYGLIYEISSLDQPSIHKINFMFPTNVSHCEYRAKKGGKGFALLQSDNWREQRKPWVCEFLDEMCIVDLVIIMTRSKASNLWGIGIGFLYENESGSNLAKHSSSGPSKSVCKWLTSISKSSNYSFLLHDIYSLRLLVFRDVLPRLGNFLTLAEHNKQAEFPGCGISWWVSIKVCIPPWH